MLRNPEERRARGRQVEAAANDERILAAALEVLIENPHAAIAQIADRAGVGVASLYRRFAGRDELARQLALHAMGAIESVAREALDRVDDHPWEAFQTFLLAAMDVGAGSMSGFAGTFQAGDELNAAGQRLVKTIELLLERVQSGGAVREDLTALDVLQLFEMLRAVRVAGPERDARLRARYVEMLAPALRAPGEALSEPPPTWQEIAAIWNP